MAFISFQPSDYFSSLLYTGTGATHNVTGVGFQPDFSWIKIRSEANNHEVYDAVRGASKRIYPDLNNAEDTNTAGLSSFDADGFTVNTSTAVNKSAGTLVSWNWKAGTTSGLSGGTITPSAYSINTTSGVGIYAYAGNSTSGATIAHGLGQAPECVMVKKVTAADSWWVYHRNTHSDITTSNEYYTVLNTTVARVDQSSAWNDTSPTDTLITLGNGGNVNSSSGSSTYIMYAFTSKKGFSKMGGYKGNADGTDAPFCYTGFRPSMVIFKCASSSDGWWMATRKILGYNRIVKFLTPDTDEAEQTGGTDHSVDFVSNGFRIRGSGTEGNKDGGDFIFMAFADSPVVSSNSIPGTAF